MDSSTRLYTRLGEIPEDPNDPESLAELLVCAFGAFERYYVCWKTQSGAYRQDGYDLPPALKDWLYPEDGTNRDFATLQVVFGRGEEYFASDKDGKLEYKEPEVKKPAEDEEKGDKPALRRARTVSFLRPLSDISTRSEPLTMEMAESRRSSAASSRRASRPPSLSFSRTSSSASILSDVDEQAPEPYLKRRSQTYLASQWTPLDASAPSRDQSVSPTKIPSYFSQSEAMPTITQAMRPIQRSQHMPSQANSLKAIPRQISDFEVPEGYMLVPISSSQTTNPTTCTCGCHDVPIEKRSRPEYVDQSLQTDPSSSPPRTALRIDTTRSLHQPLAAYSATPQDDSSPQFVDYHAENPIFMGRMMNYFSKPGYQLGDSLVSGYQTPQPVVYQYQDEFGEEALR
ncbi:hypothetical protein FB567DRAFT_161920 [Paraphoma chrysanthemicola]|uniref:Uncharacterized protein n=1 Tax=Paraphoma chrysanthemicola TaxID=798071 RepID=A0A8K0RFF1_9PLEO|nr:hypothetical protein FB567DRAFT_161920 [Paraphoma chrysanthemicola]